MKKLMLLIVIAFSTTAFTQIQSKAYSNMLNELLAHSVPEVNVQDVSDNDPNTIFLDARERREYDVSHIKNAIWIGYDDFKISRIKTIPQNTKIVVYCSVGYRSEKVSEKLITAGYQDVSNLLGSIFEWVNQGKPVYNNQGEETNEVHAYDHDWGRWLKKGLKYIVNRYHLTDIN